MGAVVEDALEQVFDREREEEWYGKREA